MAGLYKVIKDLSPFICVKHFGNAKVTPERLSALSQIQTTPSVESLVN